MHTHTIARPRLSINKVCNWPTSSRTLFIAVQRKKFKSYIRHGIPMYIPSTGGERSKDYYTYDVYNNSSFPSPQTFLDPLLPTPLLSAWQLNFGFFFYKSIFFNDLAILCIINVLNTLTHTHAIIYVHQPGRDNSGDDDDDAIIAGSGSKSHTELYGAHTYIPSHWSVADLFFLMVSPHARRTYLAHANYSRTQLTDLPLGVAAHFCFIAVRVILFVV